jgi:hypothetical protein
VGEAHRFLGRTASRPGEMMVEESIATTGKHRYLSESNRQYRPFSKPMACYLPVSWVMTGKTQKSPVKQEKFDVD